MYNKHAPEDRPRDPSPTIGRLRNMRSAFGKRESVTIGYDWSRPTSPTFSEIPKRCWTSAVSWSRFSRQRFVSWESLRMLPAVP